MYLPPGGKVVYLLGTKKNPLPQHTCPVPKNEKSKTKASAKKEDKTKQDHSRRLAILKTEISALERKLKDVYKQRNAFLLDNGIKDLKKSWKESSEKNKIHASINDLKTKRNSYFQNIQNIKAELATARQTHYLLLKNENKTDSTDDPPKISITKDRYKCFDKVENIKLDKDVNPDDLAFSGTDNGLKTMSETARFDLDRFKFHLKLHNRYQVLENNQGIFFKIN
jgi:hypothetical protein